METKTAIPVPRTVGEQIAWSFPNLARAHAALEDGVEQDKNFLPVNHNVVYNGMRYEIQVPVVE